MNNYLNDEVIREIIGARVHLLLKWPFFGSIATTLELVEAPWCNTAAVDGKHLFFNREFIKGLKKPQLLFLIAHEVLHMVFDHLGRLAGRDKDIFNMACLVWDTPILMADGSTQPIQRILPGDYVASPVGPSRVLGNMFSGIKHTMEYSIGGKKIRSTSDHKYASDNGYFTDASEINLCKGNGYVLSKTGSEGVHSRELPNHVAHGAIRADGRDIWVGREFSDAERIESEQIFAKAVQFAAMSVASAERSSLFGWNRGWGGYYHDTKAREVRPSHALDLEYLLAIEGLAGGPRVLLSGQEKQSWTPVFSHAYVGLGDRASTAEIAAVSRDQAAARSAIVARYGNPEIAAISWAVAGGSIGTTGGDYGVECARFSVGEGSGERRPVFDLVTEAGSFFANGVLTHNCDFVINYCLVKEKIGEMPECGLYDEKYTDEMSADEVYELLKKNSVTIKMPLDMHLDLGGGGEGDEVSVTVMGQNGPPKISEEDLQKIRNEVKANVIRAVQQAGNGAGGVPAGIRRMINALLEPKLDWRALLDAHIRSAVKDDYTFQKISRRAWSGDFILPAQSDSETVEVDAWIDTSGSTSCDMVTDFMSELKGITDAWPQFVLRVGCFDTEPYNFKTFTAENRDEIYEYEPKGNGGTEFNAVFEFLKAEGIEPNRLVILTDGMPNTTWGDPNYCDTLFIVHSTGIKSPWGMSVDYSPRHKKHT